MTMSSSSAANGLPVMSTGTVSPVLTLVFLSLQNETWPISPSFVKVFVPPASVMVPHPLLVFSLEDYPGDLLCDQDNALCVAFHTHIGNEIYVIGQRRADIDFLVVDEEVRFPVRIKFDTEVVVGTRCYDNTSVFFHIRTPDGGCRFPVGDHGIEPEECLVRIRSDRAGIRQLESSPDDYVCNRSRCSQDALPDNLILCSPLDHLPSGLVRVQMRGDDHLLARRGIGLEDNPSDCR